MLTTDDMPCMAQRSLDVTARLLSGQVSHGFSIISTPFTEQFSFISIFRMHIMSILVIGALFGVRKQPNMT